MLRFRVKIIAYVKERWMYFREFASLEHIVV